MRGRQVLLGGLLLGIGIVGTIFAALSSAQSLPAGYDQFESNVTIWLEGSTVVVQSDAVPNHPSPYFDTLDPRYEAYNGPNPNYQQNPNHIEEQTLEFRLPATPQVSPTHPATPLGPIGVSLNGVPFFNQYAGPNQPLTNEINSFDQYDGHPQQTGTYHYHVEPLYLTAQFGDDALLGFLLDGYPVYGPEENGETVTNGDLDQYHGHSHATAEYPSGIYHYHVTAAAPYINGTGFYGVPGTVDEQQAPTPTPAASVGGATELPGLAPANGSGGGIVIAAAGGALLAVLAAGGWYLRRNREPGTRN